MSQLRQRSGRTTVTTLPAPNAQVSQFLDEFDAFLETVRGLAGGTRRKYGRFVRHFLHEWISGAPLEWQHLSADALRAYACRELSSTTRRPSNAPFVALRAMLRFLAVKGLVAPGLEGAVPRVRRWRHATLPACLSTDEVDRVISFAASVDTHQPLRNTAIVLLLARTGMRAAEVTKLTLDDIDWENGVIRVRGTKSRRDRELPLARDVGRALLAYLKRERPSSPHRAIFLEAAPPWRPFADSSSISKIVRRAMTRANVPSARGAAHLLRHAAATNMLRQGTSFKGIADVLGHQSLQSTAIYAKLDLPALSRIAMPWPGEQA
ncbi:MULTISPECIES: tyrosine-type recombinase/integrase [Burkholderia cepacia complex]|uniref:tyrosine-type recombinase/integrase n=1 Tax=Burkholderia cepacia complex TaxID=87882 RepID=UPI0023DDD3FD|nr:MULTISPECIES: tyrosine-type recombinase/integrase [Burkholderia cepacia complex]MDF3118477.1 tyrosine-type recombinase/integrase [Burkholderia semiarida]MDI9688757.1 tyrosine-type recombinase/integrase [Burkholderia cenocepacia]MDR8074023.1 tyrosine-type recombinase/integrase [Burkholderia cenocepacia]MDR8075565.1 tyrosine-type recombinase/integrase [Burkholderia cenocepacia]